MAEPVSPPPRDREGARRRAQSHFEVADMRTALVKQIVDGERAALDARTAKLRALRLAKEETDKIESANAPPPAPKTRKKAKPAA